MKRFLSCLLLLPLIMGCTNFSFNPSMYSDRVLTQYPTEELSRLIWDYIIELKYDRRLHLENSYVVAGYNESKLHFNFISQDILEVGPARQLLVDVAEGLLGRINASGIGPELRPFPFTANQLEICIDFESYHGRFVDPFYVGWAVLENGMCYYYAFNLKDRYTFPDLTDVRFDFWHSRIEPYEKSRTYVEFERQAEANFLNAHPTRRASALDPLHFTSPPLPQ